MNKIFGKTTAGLMAAAVLAAFPAAAFAEANPRLAITSGDGGKARSITYDSGYSRVLPDDYRFLVIDGEFAGSADIKIQNNLTLVPVRLVGERLGGSVSWDDKTKSITITKGIDNIVEMTIGGNTAVVNGSKIKIASPAQLIDGVTYVPLRVIADCFGIQVGYYAPETRYDGSFFEGRPIVWVENIPSMEKPTVDAEERAEAVRRALRKCLNDFTAEHGYDAPFVQAETQKIDNLKVLADCGHYWLLQYEQYKNYSTEILVDKYNGKAYFASKDRKTGVYKVNALTVKFYSDMMNWS
ncbi:MAG: copper amine oxidase N-terminal domain-containing protein [Clostridiales bacterium]|jgi:hypothetical protein|nr:copper amine oxidase N-terminal domain-containing protein [Clostridiales bacterium]